VREAILPERYPTVIRVFVRRFGKAETSSRYSDFTAAIDFEVSDKGTGGSHSGRYIEYNHYRLDILTTT
jgi:hypothetical protein